MKPKEKDIINITRRKRIFLGVIVLLTVDIIWVVSAELSEYIFHNASFDKPFFTTYLKTSMFVLYLTGFIFIRRWQYQLVHPYSGTKNAKKLLKEVQRVSAVQTANNHLVPSENASRASTPMLPDGNITPPTFETMTDDDLSVTGSEGDLHRKKVSFSHVREVRSLGKQNSDAQMLARMSQNSVEQLERILIDVNKKMSIQETMKLSLIFVVLWMFATLMYQEALSRTSAAVTNILSSTSGIFTLVLAAIFPSSCKDKFTISKLLAVLISFSGIVLICWNDPSRKETTFNMGEVYSLLGAILYASYLVMLRKRVGEDEDKLDIPLFFGFVGLFGLAIFWPGFFLLHYTGQETFEWPADKKTWLYLIINAVVGTVLSELLWLWGCFLTSSLMATLSLGLVIPITMAWDMLMNDIKFSWLFIVGVIPVLLSFLAVSALTHFGDWDPVKLMFQKCCPCCQSDISSEEKTGLLEDEDQASPT